MPPAEWDAIAQYGFDAVWLMGVWERSPAGIAIANRNAGLMDDFHRALPDFRSEDNVGSAYCVRRYVVDQHLGGPEGLAIARQELAKRGMNLLLDFVPNHMAPDSPWIVEHPEHFIQVDPRQLQDEPASCARVGEKIFACGKDPYFPRGPTSCRSTPSTRVFPARRHRATPRHCGTVRSYSLRHGDASHQQYLRATWSNRAGEYAATVLGAT